MITYRQGNLLEAEVEAVVNTVNTVGVMGKGIALMFKERYPENYKIYADACKVGDVQLGKMFVTESGELTGPKFIINFPTKKHWRYPSKAEWIASGLEDLKKVIAEKKITSIALPPLGCGNGGLEWNQVKSLIEQAVDPLKDVEFIVYEPTLKYQNVAKKTGVEKLTPARAMIAEIVRRYWVLGIECTLLEIQKLAWFLERSLEQRHMENVLDLRFQADRYGPYAPRLNHLLNALDGSYLRCDKRISDADKSDTIAFNDQKYDKLKTYLNSGEGKEYGVIIDQTAEVIDGFQSPLGLELLSTIDWLITREKCEASVAGIRGGLENWPAGSDAAQRKLKLFNERLITIALDKLSKS